MGDLKQVKALFFPIAYYPETEFYGKSKITSHIMYAEQLASTLSDYMDLSVIRDVKVEGSRQNVPVLTVNKSFSTEILEFWKQVFFLRGTEGRSLSRDPLFNLINFSFLYNGEEVRNALLNGNEKCIFFNKSESFIFASLPELQNRVKILVIHDYYIERRRSLENNLKQIQPLTHIVDGYEQGGFKYADAIVCLSEKERIQIRKAQNDKPIFVYRPHISRPTRLKLPKRKSGMINLTYVSVNHFVARQTLLRIIESVRGQKDLVLNLAGTICDYAASLDLPENVITHGFVEDLESFLVKNDFFVAPIEMGSGFPMKIATALSSGIPILGTTYLDEIACEFSGKMIFSFTDFDGLADKIRSIEFPSESEVFKAYDEFSRVQEDGIQGLLNAISEKLRDKGH